MKDKQIHFNCPVEASLSLIGGKYKPLLWHLIDQPLHYMELQRLIPNATPKMLSSRSMIWDCGMIHRGYSRKTAEDNLFSPHPLVKALSPFWMLYANGKNYLDGLDVKIKMLFKLV